MNWKSLLFLASVFTDYYEPVNYCCHLTAKNGKSELLKGPPANKAVYCQYISTSDYDCKYSISDGNLLEGDQNICRPSALNMGSKKCVYHYYPTRCCPTPDKFELEAFTEIEGLPNIICEYVGMQHPCTYLKKNGGRVDGGEKCVAVAKICPNDTTGACDGTATCAPRPTLT